MEIHIDKDWYLTMDDAGNVTVTRPNVMKKVCTHTFDPAPYTVWDIAVWLWQVRMNKPRPLIQERFSQMSRANAEFLLSGITPGDWAKFFPPEETNDEQGDNGGRRSP